MVTYARVDIDGKKFSDYTTGNVKSNIGETNATSNFSLNYKNYIGQYANTWNVGNEVVVTIGSTFPVGQNRVSLLFDANLYNVGNTEKDITSGLVFFTNFDKNILDQQYSSYPSIPTTPRAWLPLDGGSLDIGPSGNHGVLQNGAFGLARWSQQSLVIGSGATDALRLTANHALSGLSDFTAMAMVKFSTLNSPNTVIDSKMAPGSPAFNLSYNKTGSIWSVAIGSNGSSDTSTFTSIKPFDNSWHHVAVQRAGSLVYLYEDGVVLGSSLTNAYPLGPSGIYYGQQISGTNIGSAFDTRYSLYGNIYDIRAYGSGLSSSEIAGIANRNNIEFAVTGSLAGTLSGTGVIGFAGSFDGATTYMSKALPSGLNFDKTTPFSTSCWIRTVNAGSTFRTIMSTADTYSSQKGFLMQVGSLNTNFPQVTAQLANSYSGNCINVAWQCPLNDGLWHQNVFTYDGSGTSAGFKLFFDGQLKQYSAINFNNLTGSISTKADLRVGDWVSGTALTRFPGNIDNIRMYDRTLSPDEAVNLYNVESRSGYFFGKPTALLWYPLNINANDMSGKAADGCINGGTPSFTSVPYGNLSGCMNFNGTSNYIYSGGQESHFDLQTLTVAYWANPGSVSTQMDVVSKGASSYLASLSGLKPTFIVNDGVARSIMSSAAIPVGSWSHVAYTYDKAQSIFRTYVNGSMTGSADPSAYNALAGNAVNITIGVSGPSNLGNYYTGSLSDVRIYGSALTVTDIRNLYNSASGINVLDLGYQYV